MSRPRLGDTLADVLDAFMRIANDNAGHAIVEAHVIAGPRFRWGATGLVKVTDDEGFTVRDATKRDRAEFSDAIRKGQVQITMWQRVCRTVTVLHQATGRSL